MGWDQTLNRVFNSRAYRAAGKLAKRALATPGDLLRLITKVESKLDKLSGGRIADAKAQLSTMLRMLKAHVRGDYKGVSTQSLLLLITCLAYFVFPFDLIVDFLPAVGLTDDAALIAWTLSSLADDVEEFLEWEREFEASLADSSLSPNVELIEHQSSK